MAIDNKYGRVILEHGTIGENEPVIVFRAKDAFLPKLLGYYLMFCANEGSPKRHLDMIQKAQKIIETWQMQNGSKIPDSESSREWMD